MLNSFRFNSSHIKNVKLMKAQYSLVWQDANAVIESNCVVSCLNNLGLIFPHGNLKVNLLLSF